MYRIILSIALTFIASSSSAETPAVLDVSYPHTGSFMETYSSGSAQSFTVGESGKLAFVEVALGDNRLFELGQVSVKVTKMVNGAAKLAGN